MFSLTDTPGGGSGPRPWELGAGCPRGYFQCKGSGKCVLQKVVCNGRNDCQDKSDELGTTCGKYVKSFRSIFYYSLTCGSLWKLNNVRYLFDCQRLLIQ